MTKASTATISFIDVPDKLVEHLAVGHVHKSNMVIKCGDQQRLGILCGHNGGDGIYP